MTIKVTYQKKFQTVKLEKGASTYWLTKSGNALFVLKLLSDDRFEGGEFKISIYLYSMKIKEQTRKLAAGCSKQCFEVVDRTDEVSSKHYFEVMDKTDEVSHLYLRQGETDVV